MFTKQTLLRTALTVAAVAAAAAPANAADTVVVPLATTVDVPRMTALHGTLVWSAGDRLMQRDPDGTIAPVEGAPAADYRSIDLGLDGGGDLVLTYLRCGGPAVGCAAYSDDLGGRRVRFKHLAPKRCAVSSAPARWLRRVAYGLSCARLHGPPSVHDPARTGVFVRSDTGPAQRRVQFGAGWTDHRFSTVDLRGRTVAAVIADQLTTEVQIETIGSPLTSWDGPAGGLETFGGTSSLGRGDAVWSLILTDAPSTHTELRRLAVDGCSEVEPLADTPSSIQRHDHPAEAMATDGGQIYLFVRGTGVVTHVFHPTNTCP